MSLKQLMASLDSAFQRAHGAAAGWYRRHGFSTAEGAFKSVLGVVFERIAVHTKGDKGKGKAKGRGIFRFCRKSKVL